MIDFKINGEIQIRQIVKLRIIIDTVLYFFAGKTLKLTFQTLLKIIFFYVEKHQFRQGHVDE